MAWKSRAAALTAAAAIGTYGVGFDTFAPTGSASSEASRSRSPLVASNVSRTEWRCIDGEAVLFVVGTFTVRNDGNIPTEGLRLVSNLEYVLPERDGWMRAPEGLDVMPAPIHPGEKVDIAYEFAVSEWRSDGTYRHTVALTTLNSPGQGGAPAGPTPEEAPLTVEPPVDLCAVTCTLSQGYWAANGPGANAPYTNVWPVSSVTLGTVSYDAPAAEAILRTRRTHSADGSLIGLAGELIAAKLNIAAGADPREIASIVRASDAVIGNRTVQARGKAHSEPSLSAPANALSHYNEGLTGPGACGERRSA
jgi:hypothetical protein